MAVACDPFDETGNSTRFTVPMGAVAHAVTLTLALIRRAEPKRPHLYGSVVVFLAGAFADFSLSPPLVLNKVSESFALNGY